MRELVVIAVLLVAILGAPQLVNATIGSEEFCDDNPGHFACDNENNNDENDNEISDDKEENNLSDEEKDEKRGDPKGTCYGAGYEDGQNGPFDREVYLDNCYGDKW